MRTPGPKDTETAAGCDRYQASGCDVIVAIGGGLCIDADALYLNAQSWAVLAGAATCGQASEGS